MTSYFLHFLFPITYYSYLLDKTTYQKSNKKADTVYTVSANRWCRRWDLNPHGVTRLILSQVRLPFRHSGSSTI